MLPRTIFIASWLCQVSFGKNVYFLIFYFDPLPLKVGPKAADMNCACYNSCDPVQKCFMYLVNQSGYLIRIGLFFI